MLVPARNAPFEPLATDSFLPKTQSPLFPSLPNTATLLLLFFPPFIIVQKLKIGHEQHPLCLFFFQFNFLPSVFVWGWGGGGMKQSSKKAFITGSKV